MVSVLAIEESTVAIIVASISGAVVILAAIGSALGAHVFRMRQWRYERQHDAYAHFLDTHSRTAAAHTSIHDKMVDNPPEEWADYYELIRDAATAFFDAVHRLELVASTEAVQEVRKLERIYNDRARVLYEHIESRTHNSGWQEQIAADFAQEMAALEQFTNTARRDIHAMGSLDTAPRLPPTAQRPQ